MDFEAVENLTNSTLGDEISATETEYFLVYEIIFTVLCVFGICIDSGIIYTMFRYKKMHTVPNMLVANWAIADLCVLIAIPTNYRLAEIIESMDLPLKFVSLLYEVEYNLRGAVLLFILAVVIDWCLASYFSRASQKFRKYYKFTIGFIWILVLLSLCISVGLNVHDLYFHVPVLFLFFGYFALFLFIIVLQSARAVQKCRKKPPTNPTLMLTLTTVLVMCWIPVWAGIFVTDLLYKFFPFVIELSILSTSVVTFVTLYRSNQDFQACFRQALKCSNNRYADDISEFQSFPENTNKENQRLQVYNH